MARSLPKAVVGIALGAASFAVMPGWAYEPDPALRKTIAKEVVAELLAKTPGDSRFAARFALAGNIPFNDYERLASAYGYQPYQDCTVATFAEVAAWQIARRTELDVEQIAAVHGSCTQSSSTVLGNKPLTQAVGDAAILRAVWQRNLEVTGRQLGNDQLVAAATRDAGAAFEAFRGEARAWRVGDEGFVARSENQPVPTADHVQSTQRPRGQTTVSPSPAATGGADVERMVLRTVTRYGLSGVYVTNQVYLLLKDGSIFRKPYRSPNQLDVAASKLESPKDWGTWERRGEMLAVTWSDGETQQWKTWHTCRPADSEKRLAGRFQSADAFGGANVINFNTIAFERDGRFSWDTLKGGNTEAWLPAYSKDKSAGRYELRDHTIRFRFNDGRVADYAFCLYPKDDEHFAIGANHFVPL